MAITFLKDTGTFYLATDRTCYMFRIFDKGYLLSTYWGTKIQPADLTRLWQPFPSGFSPVYSGAADSRHSLDLIPTEYPVYGGGDFRVPAFSSPRLKPATACWISPTCSQSFSTAVSSLRGAGPVRPGSRPWR